MNDYLSGIMALAQMTPEQFDLGQQRFETLRGLYGKPTSLSGAQQVQEQVAGQAIPNYSMQTPDQSLGQVYLGEVRDSSGNVVRPAINNQPASQPTMTPTQGLEGGFGTGPTPYRQPYYQSSFVNRNPYFGGYGMGYNSYMPQFGRVGTYGSPGKGGGYGGGFGSYGKGGGI